MNLNELLYKYNVPVPRYTSYPTVPNWNEKIDKAKWAEVFGARFRHHNSRDGISLYLHLPFCETLCTYCGCNKKITTNHSVEEQYLLAIIEEWKLYRAVMGETPILREIHLGGGTPTFFSPKNLAKLINAIFEKSLIHPKHEFSIEGHPNNTTPKHLETLFNLGFRRISYGVQDNDPEVQRVINRIQPFENVKAAVENARKAGFTSINLDLIYGLPLQTEETMKRTVEQVISLKPDRVAFYSYAHVPWTSRGQRLFDESDLPNADLKMKLYQLGKKLFTEGGYFDVGMDHFALPTDDLYKAAQAGRLHRNFMGYTTQNSAMLLGLGVSSISDAGVAFAQNEKTLNGYYGAIAKGELAISKGYFLTEEDVAFRKYILDISCRGKTTFQTGDNELLKAYTFPQLKKLLQDGLIQWNVTGLQVTALGKNFIRNICSAFDLHLLRNHQAIEKPLFSKAI